MKELNNIIIGELTLSQFEEVTSVLKARGFSFNTKSRKKAFELGVGIKVSAPYYFIGNFAQYANYVSTINAAYKEYELYSYADFCTEFYSVSSRKIGIPQQEQPKSGPISFAKLYAERTGQEHVTAEEIY